eukprot:UN28455
MHIATALRGRRALHFMTRTESDSQHNKAWNDVGDVYISNPHLFRHAVEYPECKWKNRVVAMQSRTLHTDEIYMKLRMLKDGHLEILAEFMKSTKFKFPTLKDVQTVEKEWE